MVRQEDSQHGKPELMRPAKAGEDAFGVEPGKWRTTQLESAGEDEIAELLTAGAEAAKG